MVSKQKKTPQNIMTTLPLPRFLMTLLTDFLTNLLVAICSVTLNAVVFVPACLPDFSLIFPNNS